MLHLLRTSILKETPGLRSEFVDAKPFRHLVIDDFLTGTFCDALRTEFPAFDAKRALNETGAVGLKAFVEKLPQIGPTYRQFDKLMQSKEFLSLVSEITGIPKLLYDPHYFGGGTHENRNGQSLDVHVDFNYHPKTHTHRRLNLIVFLNPEWDPSWGGCLELHQNPWADPCEDVMVSVVPLLNRCVIFETTEASWHGFRRITIPSDRLDISRRSIAVYFYTKERPEEEAAPRHSTVYVPERMPEHIDAGYTLTEHDVETLKILFKRRDDQIRFLYEREKEISHTWDSTLRSPAFSLARLMTAPFRLLRAALGSRR